MSIIDSAVGFSCYYNSLKIYYKDQLIFIYLNQIKSNDKGKKTDLFFPKDLSEYSYILLYYYFIF